MLDPQSALKEAIPPVDSVFVQRLWIAQSRHSGNVSYTPRAITELCDSLPTDPIAIWARTALIGIALELGEINDLVPKGNPPAALFDIASTIPLPNGLQGLNCDALATALKAALSSEV